MPLRERDRHAAVALVSASAAPQFRSDDPARRITSVSDLADDRWRSFVSGHPESTCFHRPEWTGLIADCYGFRPFLLVQNDAAGRTLAGMPVVEVRRGLGRRRWVSLPFSDEVSPLAGPGGSVTDLITAADELRQQAGVADLQVRATLAAARAPSRPVAVTHILELPSDPQEVRRLFPPAVRRSIAKASRLGVNVRLARAPDDLVSHFYRLHLATRRRQGVPVQPRRYFRLLWDRVVQPGLGFVLLADSGAEPIAGAVFLLGTRTVTYKYGASDERSWPLRPNNAIMGQAIEWACENGYERFDFGRTDAGHEGLARFKRSWGATERPLRYTSLAGRDGYQSGRSVERLLGPLIRRSPPAVCQGLGQLLYRFAA